MSEPAVDADVSNAAKIGDQHRFLPSRWRSVDHAILRLTQWSLFAIGTLFTAMITLEVVSRYVFSFSIFFVNSSTSLTFTSLEINARCSSRANSFTRASSPSTIP